VIAIVVTVVAALGGTVTWVVGRASGDLAGTKLMVGAYYYLWNPQNLSDGSLREHLVPPQAPPAALVDDHDPRTAERDITNARKAGIDFFAVDWWPLEPGVTGRLYQSDRDMADFLKASNLDQIKFAMFYETWNLGFLAPREELQITPTKARRFVGDMVYFARHFFSNPSYLRIDGRPVVFLYLTRTMTGDVDQMLHRARSTLEADGYGDPFFIGDEVYWRVTPADPTATTPVLTTTPQVSRIEQFDAVTAYTLYDGDPTSALGPTQDFVGYPGATHIVADELRLWRTYRRATDGRVPVIPVVSPGFNDRGVRLNIDHPAQPRQWLPGDGPASTLDHLFRQVAVPSVDPALPMIMVTAWDDWNEDTGVEPIPGSPTSVDDSPTGDAYTQGYTYGGEGTADIDTLRRDIAAADRDHPWTVPPPTRPTSR
jgi:hypothetical protein